MPDRTMLATVLAVTLVAAAPAEAEGPACGKRADIVKHLGAAYHERPAGLGLVDNGPLVELLIAADGSTWSMLLSYPNGTSCLVAAGRDWQPAPAAPRPGNDT